MCIHSKYHVSDCQEMLNMRIFKDLTNNLEFFPVIEKDCTEHCKKKMIKIVQLTMKHYTEIAVNYYKDAKLDQHENDCTGLTYFRYCLDKDEVDCDDDESLKRIEKVANVKRVNGQLVHFTPEGNIRDKNSTYLMDLTDSETEK